MKLFFLKQSFVVSGYRSLAHKLSQSPNLELAVGVPSRFKELGGQVNRYEPTSGDETIRSFVFPTICLHVQIVWFLGLGRALRKFFGKTETTDVFLCYAEPYSVTAFLAYLTARLTLGKRFKFVCNTFQNIKKDFSFPLSFIQTFIFKRSAAIISSNQEATEVLRAQGFGGTIWQLPLWFNSQWFFPTCRDQEGKVKVGFLGALNEDKGISDLIEALETNVSNFKDRIEVHFAGRGPLEEDVRASLLSFNERGLSSSFHGAIPFHNVPHYLNKLDILVVPSRTGSHWKEQFGRIIVEARACQVAVIGSDSGAIPEVLNDQRMVFPERNPQELRKTLDFVISNLQTLRKEALNRSYPYSDARVATLYAEKLASLTS